MSDRSLVLWMCLGQVGSLLPLSTVATLVPFFGQHWALSNAEAGWLAGSIYVGYMLAVPFLMALTDRIDARLVFLAGAATSVVAAIGFGLAADGLWSGTVWRVLAGIGLAGSYMPGLKALTDRFAGSEQSRGVASYTASYSIGAGLSYLFAGLLSDLIGWQWMFVASAGGPLLPLAIGILVLRPKRPIPSQTVQNLLDFRPVFRNRAAMGYILAYTAHCFELSAFRSWLVAFMAFVAMRHGDGGGFFSPTLVATLVTLIGLPASIFGNEISIRFGRQRMVTCIMSLSAVVGCLIGTFATSSFALVLVLVIIYAATVTGDSGSLTAGTVSAAAPDLRGATMALHSTLGFAVSFLAPLLFGLVLDWTGGQGSALSWSLAYACNGLFVLFGPLALWWARRPQTTR